MATRIVTVHSRNLAYAWSTAVIDTDSGYRMAAPAAPATQGGCQTVREQMDERRATCGPSTYYADALYVAGERVTHWRITGEPHWRETSDIIDKRELLYVVSCGLRPWFANGGHVRVEVQTT